MVKGKGTKSYQCLIAVYTNVNTIASNIPMGYIWLAMIVDNVLFHEYSVMILDTMTNPIVPVMMQIIKLIIPDIASH